MTLTFHALWMLCALGAVVFAAAAAARPRHRAALAAGFVAALVLASPSRLPDATTVGLLASAAAAIYLFRPRFALLGAACGGALAGCLSALLEVQGLPGLLSPIAAGSVLVIPLSLASARPAFAPDILRDDGLLAIGLLGLGVAVLPGVLDGWHAATNLSAAADRGVIASVPTWTLLLLLLTTCLGALYSTWSRR